MKVSRLRQFMLPLLLSAGVFAGEKPAEPFKNPYLADSAYAVTHTRANFSPLAGPRGPGRQLAEDEITWKPLGPANGNMLMYSSPYPDGRRAIWVGGYDRIAKLDADTLDVLTTYAIGGNTYYGEEASQHEVDMLDRLEDPDMLKYALKLWEEPARSLPNWYRLLSSDNELFIGHLYGDGSLALRVYGEEDRKNPASKIRLLREWKAPPDIGFIFGMQMTHDGWVVMVTQSGALIALSRDLKKQHIIQLPGAGDDVAANDIFRSFVRNGLASDDRGGVYVVTRENLHRIQWTGKELSLKESDGAWSVPYPNELGFGSGTTPALMGWGPDEDHLVVIADGTRGNNMMAFWRDEIPADWKGMQGFDRRVAGVTPVRFGVSADERVQVENSIVVYGYGAFLDNTDPVKPLPDQGNRGKQWIAESYYMHVPGHEAKGGTKIQWNPATRKLDTAWSTQLNLASTICAISGVTETLYCWGNRDRAWTLEGLDWHTGNSAFIYTLGTSHKYNPVGAPIVIAPNGAVDCACHGGMGMVRVTPKE